MPVLTELTTSARPGKRASASSAPSGMPSSSASSGGASPETCSDSQRIGQTSAVARRAAGGTPRERPARRAHLDVHAARSPRPSCRRSGTKSGWPYLSTPKRLDHRLRLGRQHEVGEGLAAGGVDARAVGGVHLHHRVDVQQRPVPLDQDRQVHALAEREERGAVGERVGVPVVGDAERGAHALPGLDVPGARRARCRPASRAPARACGCRTCRRARRSATGSPRCA